MRALLNLVHPQHPDAPTDVYPAPHSLHIPRHQQRPMSIQLPSVTRAGARAARLKICEPTQAVITGVSHADGEGHHSSDLASY
jgi:hypothetical protein